MVDKVKKRRITKDDWDTVAGWINSELARRKGNKYRAQHELIWKNVDRQIRMEPAVAYNKSGKPDEDWHSSIELGNLADASEVIAADVLRIAFPSERDWFAPHVEIPMEMSEDGTPAKPDPEDQGRRDGVLRSLMSQQHIDFGLKARIKLSIKEALHHGGFVAVARWETIPKFHDGTGVEELSAPTWVPFSMWNCYPDSSSSVTGTELFYTGSMIIEDEMPRKDFFRTKWKNKDDVSGGKDEAVKIRFYYGDLYIERNDGGIFVPNQQVVVANETVVWIETNATPYLPLIYAGYEKDDLRDPYYTSPIVKRSPFQTMASRMANKYLDAVDLRTEPPIAYDAYDPTFAAKGGPQIAPGVQIPAKGAASVKTIETADPTFSLQGLQFAIQHIDRGTGVDAVRMGIGVNTEQTAFEVAKKDQKSEIRTIDFVGTLEGQGLKPFLYMQHDLNKRKLKDYPFYNSELTTPDFLRANKSDLPDAVHFEIVGSRGLLGEERRKQAVIEVTAAALRAPATTALLNLPEIMRDVYQDAGVKNPERYLTVNDDAQNAALQQLKQECDAIVQQLQEQNAQLNEQVQKDSLNGEKFAVEKAQLTAKVQAGEAERALLEEQIQTVLKEMGLERRAAEIRESLKVEGLKTVHAKSDLERQLRERTQPQ